jgi:hypothetical protein
MLVPIPTRRPRPSTSSTSSPTTEGRDLRAFAVEALAAIEELVDAVLGAFERAQDRAVKAREKAATDHSLATEGDNSNGRDA